MSAPAGRPCPRGLVMAAVRCRPHPGLPACREDLARRAARLMASLGLSDRCVEATLVGDREMARLNADFLGLPGPTNVLSFEAGEGAGEYLGEVVVSAETCLREARLYGQDPAAHFDRLLGHGLLHLAGYPHGEAMDALLDAALSADPAADPAAGRQG
ncbi:MAG: rRNA maturation RNase YbeY [Thermodesulfobacteriota bacterium]